MSRQIKQNKKQRQNIQAVSTGMLLILFVGVFFIAKSIRTGNADEEMKAAQNNATTPAREKLTASDLNRKIILGEKLLIVDVRTADEYNQKRIPKSRSYPAEKLSSFTPEKGMPVIVVAHKNDTDTEEIVSNILKEKDVNFVFLTGGFEDWNKAGYPTLSEGDPRDFVDQSKVTYVTREELSTLLAPGHTYFIVDVQTPEAYNQKHIEGAINIPLVDLEKRATEIPSGRKIIIYGTNELDSFRAGVRLFDLNFYGVETLRGNDHLKPDSSLPLKP